MKVNRLEAHDRLLYFKKDQQDIINQGASDCLTKNPLSLALQRRSPYVYIFAHPRTADNGVDKIMLWQPRLGKPEPQTNSYLFRATSNTDLLEICWILPPQELWDQYKKGNVTESDWVTWSIDQYINNKKGLAEAFPEDFPKEKIDMILIDIAREMEEEIKMKKLYSNPINEEYEN